MTNHLHFIVDADLIHASCSACSAIEGQPCEYDSHYWQPDRFHAERSRGIRHFTFGDVRALCGATLRFGSSDQRSGEPNCQRCINIGYAVAHHIADVTPEQRSIAAWHRREVAAAFELRASRPGSRGFCSDRPSP